MREEYILKKTKKVANNQEKIKNSAKSLAFPEKTLSLQLVKSTLKYYMNMDLFTQIGEDIKKAMLARDAVRRDTLRNVKKEFIEAKTAGGANGELSDGDALKIIAKMAKKGRDAADQFIAGGRQDLADEELSQVAILEEYLPKALSPEELGARIKAIVAEIGATGPKDMGMVMKAANAQLAGQADGKAISTVVKEVLASL